MGRRETEPPALYGLPRVSSGASSSRYHKELRQVLRATDGPGPILQAWISVDTL